MERMDNATTEPGAQPTTEPTSEPKVFDEKYVQQLRKEAADYRTKLREYEKKTEDEKNKALAEQGEWKRIAEEQKAKLAELEGLTSKVASYEAEDERQLEEVKKTLPADSIALINALPANLSVRDRLKWAQQLAGKARPTLPPETRPGAGDNPSVESVMEAYMKGDFKKRAEILSSVEHSNPALYQTLTRGK